MLNELMKPEIVEMIRKRDFKNLRDALMDWEAQEIAALIDDMPSPENVMLFRMMPTELAADILESLPYDTQYELIESLAKKKEPVAELLNELSPDDRTAFLEELPSQVAQRFLNLLSPKERKIANRLLGYPEESIGRLMTTEYVAVKPDWTIKQALEHIRKFGKDSETLNVIYVVENDWMLIDDLKIREILLANPNSKISDLLDGRFVSLKAYEDQETAVKVFRDYDRVALPVTDSRGALLGIVTFDDAMDVAAEEATEDIHKIGGADALEEPYLDVGLGTLIKKRAKWLIVLFIGEMLTTSAMGYFEEEIARAVVLALFVPLIISSGGNSGSQATTIIIRAMAIGEIKLRDWWFVMRRELLSGLGLGLILGAIGILRVFLWEGFFGYYGEFWHLIGITVGVTLIGVVLLGTIFGSMLPFIMRSLGYDPAVSSAPFVATLVDVTGVVIYFGLASLILAGAIL